VWGGVVGDDGPEGIIIGQGSAAGEAFAAFQAFALSMRKRGVLLAVCSKNDEENARAAFERNTEMVLKLEHLSAFVANWHDKASNLREIASQLNIGLDALVFVDDNPFERELVRRELPMVHVPEITTEPASFAATVSAGGYFEALAFTTEDRERASQYQANRARAEIAAAATDMPTYLRSLDMRLLWKPIDRLSLKRATQLINKTNQFNLTTRRYSEEEVAATLGDPGAVTMQMRLLDRFGDNGVIAVVLGHLNGGGLEIDSWLMSCRVLGREVERATLAIIVEEAVRRGATTVLARYCPSAKNGMVADLLPKLGFSAVGRDGEEFLYHAASTLRVSDLPMTIERDDL
jgi:FkbH-like protein